MMKTLVLEYLGVDDWNRPVYKNQNNQLLKDVNCDESPMELCTVCGGFDGEPNIPITYLEKYNDIEIVIVGRENELTKEEKFNYMMLSRLKSDCDYYLGYGNGNSQRLWAGSVKKQIKEMKKIHNSFSNDKKPEWLTYKEILNYEKLMTPAKSKKRERSL